MVRWDFSPTASRPGPAPFVVDESVRGVIKRAQDLSRREGWLDLPTTRIGVKLMLLDASTTLTTLPAPGHAAGGVELPPCWATLGTLRKLSAYDGTDLRLETTLEYEAAFSPGACGGGAAPARTRATWAKVFGLAKSSETEDGVLYLSPQVAHNLSVHHDLLWGLILGGTGERGEVEVTVTKARDGDLEEACAAEMTVAKVAVPTTENLLEFTVADKELSFGHSEIERATFSLREFFKSKRLVEGGQVLAIPRKAAPGMATNSLHTANEQDLFFVKVVDVKPAQEKPTVISASNCRIILQGSTSCGTPPLLGSHRNPISSLLSNETAKTLLPILIAYFHCKLQRSSRTSIILHGPPGCNKSGCVADIASALGIHIVSLNAFDLIQPTEEKTAEVLSKTFEKCKEFSPCILLLRKGHAFGQIPHQMEKDRLLFTSLAKHMEMGNEREREFEKGQGEGSDGKRKGNIMVVTTTESIDDFPTGLRPLFSHEVEYTATNETSRENLSALPGLEGVGGEGWETVGLTPRDLRSVVSKSYELLNGEGEKEPEAERKTDAKSCFASALRVTKDRIAKTLGAPKVPSVQWSDIGGLEEAKKSIIATIETPLKYPLLFSKDKKRRSGVLLYGPPGTGKTLLAKAIATEFKMNFLSVKGPELINMYVGESERNVREVFAKARGASPCIVFFDELDSLAPARGSGGDSGGVMDRVVSQFLAELDGVQSSGKESIFVVGATNRPDLIDSALLRPGRFDCLQYIGISSSPENKENVLRALTRNFVLHEDVSLNEVARRCPETYSGADLYAVCTEAWLTAAKGVAQSRVKDGFIITVSFEDFLVGLAKVRPSLSVQEIQRYKALHEKYNQK